MNNLISKLFKLSIITAASTAAVGCASLPAPSSQLAAATPVVRAVPSKASEAKPAVRLMTAPMQLGGAAMAPQGFVEFCQREPAGCGAPLGEAGRLVLTARAAAHPGPAATGLPAGGGFDWNTYFNERAPARAQPVRAGGYDWSRAFALDDAAAPGEDAVPQAVVSQTDPVWASVLKINRTINSRIIRETDRSQYGREDYWAMPLLTAGAARGDCEDYVLEKRRALLDAGVAAEALSIAVATTGQGELHAVLLISTDRGEYVLDNLSSKVVPWSHTGYRWHERQWGGALTWRSVMNRPGAGPGVDLRAPVAAPAMPFLVAVNR